MTDENVESYLSDVDGILVPGGFGFRAVKVKFQLSNMQGKIIYLILVFA